MDLTQAKMLLPAMNVFSCSNISEEKKKNLYDRREIFNNDKVVRIFYNANTMSTFEFFFFLIKGCPYEKNSSDILFKFYYLIPVRFSIVLYVKNI